MRRWRLKYVTERRMSFQCSISEILSYWLQAAHLIASLQRTLPFLHCIERWTLVEGAGGHKAHYLKKKKSYLSR